MAGDTGVNSPTGCQASDLAVGVACTFSQHRNTGAIPQATPEESSLRRPPPSANNAQAPATATAGATCRICQPPRTFNSSRGLANHMRTHRSTTSAANQPLTLAVRPSTSAPLAITPALAKQFVCPYCPRSFDTKTGLGVHRKSQHPDIMNAEISVDRARKALSQEELRMAATEEAFVIKNGHDGAGNPVCFINIFLAPYLPGRSSDGIKYARNTAAYCQLLDEAVQALSNEEPRSTLPSAAETAVSESSAITSAHTVEEDDAIPSDPRVVYADAIRGLMHELSEDDSFEGHPLVPLAEQPVAN